jgi:hypothetical protein
MSSDREFRDRQHGSSYRIEYSISLVIYTLVYIFHNSCQSP